MNADVPDVDALEQAAGLERTVKRPDRALAFAERARKLGASQGRVAIMTGAALAAKDDPTGALKSFRTVAKSDPLFFEANLRVAELLRDKGKVDEAGRALDAAGGVVSDRAHRVELALARSQLEEKRGDAARAARVLDDALAETTGDGLREDRLDRLILERAAVDDSPRRLAARPDAGYGDPGARAPQRRGAQLRRLRGGRPRAGPAARDHAAAGGDGAVPPARAGSSTASDGPTSAPAIWRAPTASSSRPGGWSPPIPRSSGTSPISTPSATSASARSRRTSGPWRCRRAIASRGNSASGCGRSTPRAPRADEAHEPSVGARRARARSRHLGHACAHTRPLTRSYAAPAPEALAGALAARQSAVRGMSARVRATSWLGGERVRATVNMLVERGGSPPLRGRGELAGNGRHAGHRPARRSRCRRAQERAVARPACPANVASMIRIPLEPADVAAVLLGDARLPADAEGPPLVGWEPHLGADVLAVRDRRGGALQLFFHGDGATRELVAATRVGADGAPLWRTQYQDFETIAGQRLPRTILFAERNASFDDGCRDPLQGSRARQRGAGRRVHARAAAWRRAARDRLRRLTLIFEHQRRARIRILSGATRKSAPPAPLSASLMLARSLLVVATAEASPMKRQRHRHLFLSAPLFFLSLFLLACQSQSLTSHTGTSSMLPAVTVSDSCSASTKASDCPGDTDSLCTWVPRRRLPRRCNLSGWRLRDGRSLRQADDGERLSGQRHLRLVGYRGNGRDAGALSGRSDLQRRRVLLHARAFGLELPLRAAAGLPGKRGLPARPMRLPAAACGRRRQRGVAAEPAPATVPPVRPARPARPVPVAAACRAAAASRPELAPRPEPAAAEPAAPAELAGPEPARAIALNAGRR